MRAWRSVQACTPEIARWRWPSPSPYRRGAGPDRGLSAWWVGQAWLAHRSGRSEGRNRPEWSTGRAPGFGTNRADPSRRVGMIRSPHALGGPRSRGSRLVVYWWLGQRPFAAAARHVFSVSAWAAAALVEHSLVRSSNVRDPYTRSDRVACCIYWDPPLPPSHVAGPAMSTSTNQKPMWQVSFGPAPGRCHAATSTLTFLDTSAPLRKCTRPRGLTAPSQRDHYPPARPLRATPFRV